MNYRVARWWTSVSSIRSMAFADQSIVSGGNFLTAILMARAFGAYEFGWFTLAWLVVEFMSSLQFAGVLQPMLTIGAKEEKRDRAAYYKAVAAQQLVVAIALALLVSGCVWIAAQLFVEPALERLALPLGVATAAYQAQNFFRRYLFAREQATAAMFSDLLRFVIQVATLLALPFFWKEPSAEVGVWIVACACCISSLQGAVGFGRVTFEKATFNRVLERHWGFSKWLLPSALMYWMTSQAFVLMSGVVLGPAATGTLKVALSIAGILNILVQGLDSFAPTQAARALHEGGHKQVVQYVTRLAVLAGIPLVAMGALLSVNPDSLVQLIYGSGYSGAGHLVRWACAGALIYGLAQLFVIWAAAIEQTSIVFRAYGVASIFTIGGSYPLTLYGGLEGVLAGGILTEVIKVVVLMVPLMRWNRNVALR